MTEIMYFVVPKTRTVSAAKTAIKATPLSFLVDGIFGKFTPAIISDMRDHFAFKIPSKSYDENLDNIESCRKTINNGTVLMSQTEFDVFRKDKILAIDAPRDVTLAVKI